MAQLIAIDQAFAAKGDAKHSLGHARLDVVPDLRDCSDRTCLSMPDMRLTTDVISISY